MAATAGYAHSGGPYPTSSISSAENASLRTLASAPSQSSTEAVSELGASLHTPSYARTHISMPIHLRIKSQKEEGKGGKKKN
jgi:hypothetical protein